MSSTTLSPQQRTRVIAANRWIYRISRYWIVYLSLGFGLYVGLPFLAPAFMQVGWERMANIIYTIYTFLCHQLPQRSLFIYGQKTMYSLNEIQAAWQNTIHPLVLRQFIGNSEMGWKVAWSDRMISMYTSILFFAWLWWPFRKKLKPLPWWGLIIFLFPMVFDGIAHMISDIAGIGQGFRDSNHWLVALTNNALSPSFYAGDALGSFNSWMRWLTGILFGLGFVWFSFPYLDAYFAEIIATIEAKFRRAELKM